MLGEAACAQGPPPSLSTATLLRPTFKNQNKPTLFVLCNASVVLWNWMMDSEHYYTDKTQKNYGASRCRRREGGDEDTRASRDVKARACEKQKAQGAGFALSPPLPAHACERRGGKGEVALAARKRVWAEKDTGLVAAQKRGRRGAAGGSVSLPFWVGASRGWEGVGTMRWDDERSTKGERRVGRKRACTGRAGG